MRRIVVAVMSTISGLVLLFSYYTSTGSGATVASGEPTTGGTGTTESATPSTEPSTAARSSSASSSSSSGGSAAASGTFTGDAVATRWGDVQVQITVSDGKVTRSEAVVYPQGNNRDQEINAYALPVLAQEVVGAQSAQIDAVSGATVTSDGYISSLQSALDQAHL